MSIVHLKGAIYGYLTRSPCNLDPNNTQAVRKVCVEIEESKVSTIVHGAEHDQTFTCEGGEVEYEAWDYLVAMRVKTEQVKRIKVNITPDLFQVVTEDATDRPSNVFNYEQNPTYGVCFPDYA